MIIHTGLRTEIPAFYTPWLLNRLRPLGYERAESVLLASLDTQGRLFVQGKGEQGKMHLVQALEKKAAGW